MEKHWNSANIKSSKVHDIKNSQKVEIWKNSKAAENHIPQRDTHQNKSPKALFETPDLLHNAKKSTLADSIWTSAKQKSASLPESAQFVLDGGALLHRIPWPRGSTFGAILNMYIDFVLKNYAEGIIVFDGYETFSKRT